MVLRRVGPLSLAKIVGTLYAILGLVFGAIFTLVALLGTIVGRTGGDGWPFSGLFGFAAIIVLPIFYGGLGFVTSLITAAIYNALASSVGGIEVELQ